MEEKYQYREITTGETVEDFMAENYVIDKLGLVIMPKRREGDINTGANRFYK